ncbi:MAG: nucleotidyltransferase family protein [Cyanobacteria bacterium J06643_5]
MGIADLLLPFREEILRIATKHGAYNVRVFGSVARGEATPDSDIDFLVELEPGRNLLDRIALIQDLEELLNRKVDVAKPSNLHELIREKVVSEAIIL